MGLIKSTAHGTILNGQAMSSPVDFGSKVLCAIVIPAAWTAAALTFQASDDGGATWWNIHDSAGNEVTVPSAAAVAGRRVSVDPSLFAGVDFIQVRSGTSAAPVNQGANRVLLLIAMDPSQAFGVRSATPGTGSATYVQNPWTANVDGGGHDLSDVGQVIANTGVFCLSGTDIMSENQLSLTWYNGTWIPRWKFMKSGTETGTGNAGSDLLFANYDDSGNSIGVPVTVRRSNGFVGLGNSTSPTHMLELSADSASKPTTNTWTIFSDARLKRNIQDLAGGLAVIEALRPVEAEYNGLHNTPEGQRVVSFLAHEIAQVLPGTVSSHRGKLHPDDAEETDILDFNLHEVLIHLVLAVQQLAAKLAAQQPEMAIA